MFVALGLLVAVAALAVVAVLELSGITLTRDAAALARVDIQPLGGTVQPAQAKDQEGRPIALTDAGGKLTPAKRIAPGTKVTIVVTARRPGWNAWLLGKTASQAPDRHRAAGRGDLEVGDQADGPGRAR